MNPYCNNCGKNGHQFHQCKSPIISYGIIAFRENPTKNTNQIRQDSAETQMDDGSLHIRQGSAETNTNKTRSPSNMDDGSLHIRQGSAETNNTREYLLIRRKDTLGFVDFMRGKYSIYNKEYILNMIKQMTNDEKRRLVNDSFSKLWEDLWGIPLQTSSSKSSSHIGSLSSEGERIRPRSNVSRSAADTYKAEEQSSKTKFESLKLGVYTKTDSYNLEELVRMTEDKWTEAEWGFPKGRRNYQERDYDCAVREFCEETGYSLDKLVQIRNIQPFEEIFTGSNYKSYKHKYYVTYMRYEDTLSSRRLQACEVSESEWMSAEVCNSAIRSYNVEKKRLLAAVENMLNGNFLSHSPSFGQTSIR